MRGNILALVRIRTPDHIVRIVWYLSRPKRRLFYCRLVLVTDVSKDRCFFIFTVRESKYCLLALFPLECDSTAVPETSLAIAHSTHNNIPDAMDVFISEESFWSPAMLPSVPQILRTFFSLLLPSTSHPIYHSPVILPFHAV
jgi:hypothetical protein